VFTAEAVLVGVRAIARREYRSPPHHQRRSSMSIVHGVPAGSDEPTALMPGLGDTPAASPDLVRNTARRGNRTPVVEPAGHLSGQHRRLLRWEALEIYHTSHHPPPATVTGGGNGRRSRNLLRCGSAVLPGYAGAVRFGSEACFCLSIAGVGPPNIDSIDRGASTNTFAESRRPDS